MKKISLTIDLEDPSGGYSSEGRYVRATHKVLDFCDEFGRLATFFVVGKLAAAAPDLIQEIAARGHEIAYHSHEHIVLTKETPLHFKKKAAEDRDFLEQLIGQRVVGFRAPCFSLNMNNQWVTDILAELGFTYSSSVMPTRISRYGMPDAPKGPFRWPSGLLELPLPVAKLGPLHLPFSGGIYLYSLPFPVTQALLKRAPTEALWTYAHPYDFDVHEPFQRMAGTSWGVSLFLWYMRIFVHKKMQKMLILHQNGPLLRDLAADLLSQKAWPQHPAKAR